MDSAKGSIQGDIAKWEWPGVWLRQLIFPFIVKYTHHNLLQQTLGGSVRPRVPGIEQESHPGVEVRNTAAFGRHNVKYS